MEECMYYKSLIGSETDYWLRTSYSNYVTEEVAKEKELIYDYDDLFTKHFVLRADSWTKLNASGPGRDSVRLESKNYYDEFVAV
jgi:hypothetical protein